jgi:GNAT superfamily N-acetyltransferase
MARIVQAHIDEHFSQVRDLFWEYLQWANSRVEEEFSVSFDIETMLEEDMANLAVFLPPDGRLLLASEEDQVAGLGCLKKIRGEMGELKRMYVRPEFRRRGLGRAILDALIAEAREIGYRTLRLDSARFMKAAHALYQSEGFREIDPYPESEIPPEFQENWIFMEKCLEG